jgi:hypothetical protein
MVWVFEEWQRKAARNRPVVAATGGQTRTMNKKCRLSADQIKPLATGRGTCYASDRITVDGHMVGYMYREESRLEFYSGWTFLSGRETQEFEDDPKDTMLYDVNTIANYDPEIIPFLDAPIGSAFERDTHTGKFVEVPFELSDD